MLTSAVKRLVMSASHSRLWDAVVGRMERQSAGRGCLRVLAYHRIDLPENRPLDYPGLISASPAEFCRQMEFLAEKYCAVSLDQVLAAAKREDTLPENAVLLTFDDATVDFAEHAWPVLKSLKLPATVFVPTAYPDEPGRHFWWNRLYRAMFLSADGSQLPTQHGPVTLTSRRQRRRLFRAWKEQFKTLPDRVFQTRLDRIVDAASVPDPADNGVLSWPALLALHRDGVTLAPHTHTHPMLNRLPRDAVLDELATSRERLATQLNDAVPAALAYPAGGFNDTVLQAMADLKYSLGFTTERGLNSTRLDAPYCLRRINVGSMTTIGLLRLQLANWGV